MFSGWNNKGWGSGGGDAEPIEGDYYQPMTTGNDDDLLTPTIMETGDIIRLEDPTISAFWTNPNGEVFVSTDIDTQLPGPVDVDGTEYTINSGLSWKWLNEFQSKFVTIAIENSFSSTQFYDQMVIGCYFQAGDGDAENFHDVIQIAGTFDVTAEFCVMQVHGIAGALKMNVHTNGPDGDDIDIIAGKKYWINLLFDGINEVGVLSIFDPANGFSEIAGSPSTTVIQLGRQTITESFGRTDAHGNNATNTGTSYVGQIVMGLNSNAPIIPTIGGGPSNGWANGGWGN